LLKATFDPRQDTSLQGSQENAAISPFGLLNKFAGKTGHPTRQGCFIYSFQPLS